MSTASERFQRHIDALYADSRAGGHANLDAAFALDKAEAAAVIAEKLRRRRRAARRAHLADLIHDIGLRSRRRVGPPRLDQLTTAQRRLVLALIDAAKDAANQPDEPTNRA